MRVGTVRLPLTAAASGSPLGRGEYLLLPPFSGLRAPPWVMGCHNLGGSALQQSLGYSGAVAIAAWRMIHYNMDNDMALRPNAGTAVFTEP